MNSTTTKEDQLTAFPKTTLEVLEELAALHQADYNKAVNALDALADDEKIAKAYAKAEGRVAQARRLVGEIDAVMERERRRISGKSVSMVAAEIVNSGALDSEGLTVTAVVNPPGVDPITGEIPSAPPVVIALYPGEVDVPHVTVVGDRTQYGELVADYFTAAGLNGNHDAKDWTVLAEDELTAPGGGRRKLRDLIAPADYGRRLIVAAADQGSAAG